MKNWVVLLTLIAALGLVNFAIFQKEQLLQHGDTVYLKLAPLDPRSIMQGDYMALRFELADEIEAALTAKALEKQQDTLDGQVQVQLNDQRIARFISIESALNDKTDLSLQFRLRNGQIKFATNAYFFEEGTGNILAGAQLGEFKVGEDGELLLISLTDESLKQLGNSTLR